MWPSASDGPPFVLIGNPGCRRVELFQAALAGLGLPPAYLVAYADLLAGNAHLAEVVPPGAVVRIDRFGNVVTNLDRKACERVSGGQQAVQVTVGGQSIARIVSTYSDIEPGEIGALFGSTDHLEFAAQSTSAAERLGVAVGDAVEMRRA